MAILPILNDLAPVSGVVMDFSFFRQSLQTHGEISLSTIVVQ
jgi:hypothetical protein